MADITDYGDNAVMLDSNGKVMAKVAAQLIGSSVEEVATVSTNFVGKVPGSLVENPSIAKRAVNPAILLPAHANWIEVNSTVISQIANEDGTVHTYSTTGVGSQPQGLWSFNILEMARKTAGVKPTLSVAELRTILQEITPRFVGWGTGASGGITVNGVTVRIWNKTTSAYEVLGNHSSSSPTAVTATYANLTNYVDDSGFVHIHATPSNPSDGTIASALNTDQPSLSFKLLANVPIVLSVQGKETLISKNLDTTAAIVTAGSETITVTATIGRIADILHYGVSMPAVGTSGSHKLSVYYNSTGDQDKLLEVTAEAAQSILVVRGVNKGSATLVVPSDPAVQLANTLGLSITDTVTLKFVYRNDTNDTQYGARVYRVVLNERTRTG